MVRCAVWRRAAGGADGARRDGRADRTFRGELCADARRGARCVTWSPGRARTGAGPGCAGVGCGRWTERVCGRVVGDGPGRSLVAAECGDAARPATALTARGSAARRGLARGVVRDRGAGECCADSLGAELAAVGPVAARVGGALRRRAWRLAGGAGGRLRAGAKRVPAGRAVAAVGAGVAARLSAGGRGRGVGRHAEPILLGRVRGAERVRLRLAGTAR